MSSYIKCGNWSPSCPHFGLDAKFINKSLARGDCGAPGMAYNRLTLCP